MRRKSRFLPKALLLAVALTFAFSSALSAVAGVVDGKIVVGGGNATGYAPHSTRGTEYNLNGPVASGSRVLTDLAKPSGTVTEQDNLIIQKVATPLDENRETTVTLTVDAKPAHFTYQPPPTLDYILVVDVTSSMLQPYRDNPQGRTEWQMFWDPGTRITQLRAAIKEAARDIWDSNPNSTITVVPFGNDVFKPLPTGGFAYGDNTSLRFMSDGGQATPNAPSWAVPGMFVNSTSGSQVSGGNEALTSQFNYYMLTEPADSAGYDQFDKSIDSLPLISNTGTPAGMREALNILQSGDLVQTEQSHREVFLLTDGGANWPWPSGTHMDNYPARQQEVADICDLIKDPAQGNAVVNVVSIDPEPIAFSSDGFKQDGYAAYDSSGNLYWLDPSAPANGFTALDVRAGMRDLWATSPAHYFDAETGYIEQTISTVVRETIDYYAGFTTSLNDALNIQYFEMVSTQPDIEVTVNGVTYAFGDPACPIKASDITFTSTGLRINLGVLPYGESLMASSTSSVKVSYKAKVLDSIGAHFEGLHTNIDDQTYLTVQPPSHTLPQVTSVDYDSRFWMPFPTPVVTLDDDAAATRLTLKKTDMNGAFLAGSAFDVSTSGANDLTVTPSDAQGETFVLAPGAVYTITEIQAPAQHQPLATPVQITVDANGIPSITSGASSLVSLSDPVTENEVVSATLTVKNAPVIDEPDPPSPTQVFHKVPDMTTVEPGGLVTYTISGFANNTGQTLTNYTITDLPPKGLDLTSISAPAFANGSGLTYSVKYRTNQRGNTVLKSGLSASAAQTISAPALSSGEYLTAIAIVFDTVPSGFGRGNTITLQFRVAQNPPTKTLTNRSALSYRINGDEVVIDDPGVPVDTGTGGSGNGGGENLKTGDTGHIMLLGAFTALLAAATVAMLTRKRREGSRG